MSPDGEHVRKVNDRERNAGMEGETKLLVQEL